MPISPFAREALAEILAELEKTGDRLASLVFQEGLEDEIPATVPEDVQSAIAALESALEADSATVAEANMAARRAAWNEAEGAFNEAQARRETACKAERLGMLDGATIRLEADTYYRAESAYLEAKAEAEKAGFL